MPTRRNCVGRVRPYRPSFDRGKFQLKPACNVFDIETKEIAEDTISHAQRAASIVVMILQERDLEVRPLDSRLGKVPNISSASLLEN